MSASEYGVAPAGPGPGDPAFFLALAGRLALAFEDAARDLEDAPDDDDLRHRREVAATAFRIALSILGGVARSGDTVYDVADGLRVRRGVPELSPPASG